MAAQRENGFILIALVIAMVVIAILITALISINVTRNLSEPLYVNSTQAFYIAHAGAEFGMRYATENISAFCADPVGFITAIGTKNFGNGTFVLSFDNANNRLTSLAQVGTARRSVRIDSFTQFLPTCSCFVLDPSYTPNRSGNVVNFRMLNNCGCSLRIFYVYIAKTGGNQARLNRIRFNGSTRWSGTGTWVSTNPASPTLFNTTDYDLPTGARLCDLRCVNATQVTGTWYVTFYYNDCSGTLTSTTVSFTIT
jgi:hypothetical protein